MNFSFTSYPRKKPEESGNQIIKLGIKEYKDNYTEAKGTKYMLLRQIKENKNSVIKCTINTGKMKENTAARMPVKSLKWLGPFVFNNSWMSLKKVA